MVSWFVEFLRENSRLRENLQRHLSYQLLFSQRFSTHSPESFCKSCSIWWIRTQKLWVSRTTAIKFIISIFASFRGFQVKSQFGNLCGFLLGEDCIRFALWIVKSFVGYSGFIQPPCYLLSSWNFNKFKIPTTSRVETSSSPSGCF